MAYKTKVNDIGEKMNINLIHISHEILSMIGEVFKIASLYFLIKARVQKQ